MTGTRAKGGPASFDRPHQGRVALIIGGSRGIGQSVAVELARRGAHVVIGARTDQSETAQLVADAEGEALALTLDISDPASVEEARAQVEAGPGRVDILVNNAATFENVSSPARESDSDSAVRVDARVAKTGRVATGFAAHDQPRVRESSINGSIPTARSTQSKSS
jgi:NAD(P)-dependent dehydrogenase (short-subunit alcohol dehydrogenase family)